MLSMKCPFLDTVCAFCSIHCVALAIGFSIMHRLQIIRQSLPRFCVNSPSPTTSSLILSTRNIRKVSRISHHATSVQTPLQSKDPAAALPACSPRHPLSCTRSKPAAAPGKPHAAGRAAPAPIARSRSSVGISKPVHRVEMNCLLLHFHRFRHRIFQESGRLTERSVLTVSCQ